MSVVYAAGGGSSILAHVHVAPPGFIPEDCAGTQAWKLDPGACACGSSWIHSGGLRRDAGAEARSWRMCMCGSSWIHSGGLRRDTGVDARSWCMCVRLLLDSFRGDPGVGILCYSVTQYILWYSNLNPW